MESLQIFLLTAVSFATGALGAAGICFSLWGGRCRHCGRRRRRPVM